MGLSAEDIKIDIVGEGMEAVITLLNEEVAAEITEASLKQALATAGIKRGIDEERLAAMAAEPAFNTPQVVAQGQSAQDGTDEAVTYHFPVGEQEKVKEIEGGALDYRNIDTFNNYPAGEMLAEKSAATVGHNGFNVRGDELKARDGKSVGLKVGKGAKLSDDGMSVVSEIAGHACLVGDRISVLDTIEVAENLDFAVGNIDFVGNVRIRGDVMPGFNINAKGDIEIGGNVEKATITCGGNLEIRGNVFGYQDTLIEVTGDATIKAIDLAEVRVHGNLTVNNYIRHSQVWVGGSLELSGQKGQIVAGEAHAYQGITSPFIGNSMATLTKLTVGTNPLISNQIADLQRQRDEIEQNLRQTRTALDILRKRAALGSGPVNAKTEEMLQKLEATEKHLAPQLEELVASISEEQNRSVEFKEAKIRVSQVIYPGVIVCFRNRLQYKTQDELQNVAFSEKEGEISADPL